MIPSLHITPLTCYICRAGSHNGLHDISADSADDLGPHSPLEEDFSPGGTWNLRGGQGDSYDAGDTSDVSISAAKVSNDGKHPLLEFAMSHFRENNFDIHPHDENMKDKKIKLRKHLKRKAQRQKRKEASMSESSESGQAKTIKSEMARIRE